MYNWLHAYILELTANERWHRGWKGSYGPLDEPHVVDEGWEVVCRGLCVFQRRVNKCAGSGLMNIAYMRVYMNISNQLPCTYFTHTHTRFDW